MKDDETLMFVKYGGLHACLTIHTFISIRHHWFCALDDGKSVRTLLVDFSKAFDGVDHNILLNIMTYSGVHKLLIRSMFSFMCSRKQRVEIGSVYSEWVDLIGAGPQGIWLGPLTFVIYLNDLTSSSIIHRPKYSVSEKKLQPCALRDKIAKSQPI